MDLGKKTYQMSRPVKTHWRVAKCREVLCRHYVQGWLTILPVGHDQAGWIRHDSGLRFVETVEGGMVQFKFNAEQECFKGRAGQHKIQLERDPLFLIDGRTTDYDPWMDNFRENQYQIGRRREMHNA